MAYYLHRATPIDEWRVYIQPPESEGETMYLGDAHWFSEAQAEADRLNGKRQDDGGQGSFNF